MLRYLNGVILYKLIPGETALVINMSKENGSSLEQDISNIINSYKKHISCICITYFPDVDYEYQKILEVIKENNLNICLLTEDFLDVNKQITKNVDYIITKFNLECQKIYKKDYCPLIDSEDWIEINL